jgi:hypothetical protein
MEDLALMVGYPSLFSEFFLLTKIGYQTQQNLLHQ